jgi:serine protease
MLSTIRKTFAHINLLVLPLALVMPISVTPLHNDAEIVVDSVPQTVNHLPDAQELFEKYRPQEIVVKLRGNTLESVNRKYGTVLIKNHRAGFHTLRIPAGEELQDFLQILRQNPEIEIAEPNYIARAFFTPNDQYYRLQWHLNNPQKTGINSERAWDTATGQGVVVAVVDTGIAYENFGIYRQAPDLAGTLFVPGYDFVNEDTHANDDNGHGTHVAGTIAQATNNSIGAAGVAFQASLMPVKVLAKNGSGSYADVADGIRFAADKGAHIINLSLGGPVASSIIESAVRYTYEKGVSIIAASGNDSASTVSYPAAYDCCVLAVGATRFDEQVAPYSNRGNSLDLTAPGGDLKVDQNGDGYKDGVLQQTFSRDPRKFGYYFFQGTSMATPHVAGVAALLRSLGVTGPDQIRSILTATARDRGAAGWDSAYGFGIVDAERAINSILTGQSTQTGQLQSTSNVESPPVESPSSTKSLKVADVHVVLEGGIFLGQARAEVTIVDNFGSIINAATVIGHWEGVLSGVTQGTTDSSGYASFTSARIRFQAGEYAFVVDGVKKDGYTYEPGRNPDRGSYRLGARNRR